MANNSTVTPLSKSPEITEHIETHAPENVRNNQEQDRTPQRGNNAGVEVPRRPRGRPPGSRNKPKPHIINTREREFSLKQHVLEISAGCDIIDALIGFACRLNVGITVLSGVGDISRATLRNALPPRMPFTVDGPLNLLSLNGSIVASLLQPSSSTCRSVLPSRSAFTMSVSGADGHVLGGIVAGSVVAASTVTVLLWTFLDPRFHRVSNEGGNSESDQPSNNGVTVAIIPNPSYGIPVASNPSITHNAKEV